MLKFGVTAQKVLILLLGGALCSGLQFHLGDREAWQGMQDKLEDERKKGYWYNFSSLAMAMKILASPDIRIPEEGGLEVR